MSSITFAAFPILPDNVQRSIFEHAADESQKRAAVIVSLSRTIKSWIEPRLYRNIIADDRRAVRLVETIRNSGKSAAFFQENVKNLCFRARVSASTTCKILAVCSGLEELATWEMMAASDVVSFPQPSLLRLSIKCLNLPPFSQLYPRLTHLELSLQSVESHTELRNLRYLSIHEPSYVDLDSVDNTLATLFANLQPSIRVVLVWRTSWTRFEDTGIIDDRVVIGDMRLETRSTPEPSGCRWVLDFLYILHTRGYALLARAPHLWEEAERLVEERRRFYAENSTLRKTLIRPKLI